MGGSQQDGHARVYIAARGSRGMVVHARVDKGPALPRMGLAHLLEFREVAPRGQWVCIHQGCARDATKVLGQDGEFLHCGDGEIFILIAGPRSPNSFGSLRVQHGGTSFVNYCRWRYSLKCGRGCTCGIVTAHSCKSVRLVEIGECQPTLHYKK